MPKSQEMLKKTELLSNTMTKKQILAMMKTLPLSELSKLMKIFLQSLSNK